ncbi:MAG: type II toxin-antitoxin system prevent-host-death family antitoxin [Candidatus Paceibacterota bacterium]|jgi:prevent-host-death family protein
MDINEIKKIIKEDKAKIIIADQGEPILVVMSYEDYQALKKSENKPDLARKNIPTQEPEKKEIKQTIEDDLLKIEDLPF